MLYPFIPKRDTYIFCGSTRTDCNYLEIATPTQAIQQRDGLIIETEET